MKYWKHITLTSVLGILAVVAIIGCSSNIIQDNKQIIKISDALLCLQRGHIEKLDKYDLEDHRTGIIDNDTLSYSVYSIIRYNSYHCLRCGYSWTICDTALSDTTFYWRKK